MASYPIRLIVSLGGGFNFVLLDPEHDTNDLGHDAHEALMDELWEEAQRRGEGTHVLTVRI
jgi:hypothetical protein